MDQLRLQLLKFLRDFHRERRAGLLIAGNEFQRRRIASLLRRFWFQHVRNSQGILKALRQEESVVIELDRPLTWRMYEIISQCSREKGEIFVPYAKGEFVERIFYSPHKTQVLILMTRDHFKDSESEFPLREKVGQVYFLDDPMAPPGDFHARRGVVIGSDVVN